LFGSESPPFVCLAVQSHKYKKAVDVPVNRFYGQLIDDPFASISGIENYLPVIKYLTSRGIAVLRMGVMEDEKLPSDLGPLVVDYAFDGRTEFGDLWLHSRCQFSINAGSGAHWLAAVFNVPAVLTDSYAIRSLYDERSLFIPQRGWLFNEHRYLTFSEISNDEFGRDVRLLQNGMQIIKNSPNEIIEVTEEMICRLAGTWIETRQDKDLQSRYRKIVDEFPAHQRTPARIGAKFLREHQYLLPD
jgi:putative glycosyltransferase (TIGR04372 family)